MPNFKQNLIYFLSFYKECRTIIYNSILSIINITGFYLVNYRSDITSNYVVEWSVENPYNIELESVLPEIFFTYDQMSQLIIIIILILNIILFVFRKFIPVTIISIIYAFLARYTYKLYNGIYIESYTIMKNYFFTISKKLNECDYLDIYNSVMNSKFKNVIFENNIDFEIVLPTVKGVNDVQVVENIITELMNKAIKMTEEITNNKTYGEIIWEMTSNIASGCWEHKEIILCIGIGIGIITYIYIFGNNPPINSEINVENTCNVEELSSTVEELSSTVEELSSTVEELSSTVEKLSCNFSILEGLIKLHDNVNGENTSSISELQEKLSAKVSYASLKLNLDKFYNSLDAKITFLDKKISAVSQIMNILRTSSK